MRRIWRRIWRSIRRLNRYHLVSRWRVRGNAQDVCEILFDIAQYPRWWKDVFLSAKEGKPTRRGRVAEVITTGLLPYRIRFAGTLSSANFPNGFTVRTRGDFVGQGRWTLKQVGSNVHIKFEWQIRVEKPVVRQLSFLLKPLFIANHRWSMARGEKCLRRALESNSDWHQRLCAA